MAPREFQTLGVEFFIVFMWGEEETAEAEAGGKGGGKEGRK